MRHLANAQYWDRPAGGNTGRLFLAFGGPVCADRFSNCPLDRVLTYKNLIYLLNLQFHMEIYLLCYIHFMASPGLKRGIIQRFIASFEEFLCTCRREESWVRGRVSSLQHSFCWSEACIYHDSPPFNSTLSSNTACMSMRRN